MMKKAKEYTVTDIKNGGKTSPQPFMYVTARDYNDLLKQYKEALFLLKLPESRMKQIDVHNFLLLNQMEELAGMCEQIVRDVK